MQIVALLVSALSGLASVYVLRSERHPAKTDTEIAEQEANKSRQDLLSLLKEVRRQWITEYLDNSLYHRVMIELGKNSGPRRYTTRGAWMSKCRAGNRVRCRRSNR